MDELPFCECGCGEHVSKSGNRFKKHHQRRGSHHNEATKEKIAETMKQRQCKPPSFKGKQHSLETKEK